MAQKLGPKPAAPVEQPAVPFRGHLSLAAGEYGQLDDGTYVVRPPRGDAVELSEAKHGKITVEPDGTLTVEKVIQSKDLHYPQHPDYPQRPKPWRGRLTKGVWVEEE